jgi:hypothetical protein
MNRVIRLAGELDRYHGYGRAQIAAAPASAPPARKLLLAKPAPEDVEVEAEMFRPAKP